MNKRFLYIVLSLFTMIGCGLWCSCTRQEIWYDLYNYHFYNGFALLNGQTFTNHFVSGIYTFFAPLLDAITYLEIISLNHYPDLIFFINGSFHALIYILAFFILKLFFPVKTKTDKFLFLALLLYSVTGFAFVRQLGSTCHELTVTAIFLLALYLFLKKLSTHYFSLNISLLIGFVTGCSLGLKLTVFPMTFGLGISILYAALTKQIKHPIKTCCYMALGGIIGILITDGWWLYLTWQQTGNPIFPMANNIFKSPLLPAETVRDARFLPQTIWQALFYPFYWITGHEYVTDIDAKTYIFHGIIPFICLIFLTLQLFRKSFLSQAEKTIVIFYAASYITWLILFSILRYAATLEVLSGVLIFLTIRQLSQFNKRILGTLILIVALLCPMGYPLWRKPLLKTYMPEIHLTVPDDTVFAVVGDLSSFVVPRIKTNNPILGFTFRSFAFPLPWDNETKQLYRSILSDKKMMLFIHPSTILQLKEKWDFWDKLGNNIQYSTLTSDTAFGRYFLLFGEKDENGIIHGFHIPGQYLDNFLDLMVPAKN